ncbi:MAG: phosphate ABC transporter substrate-binding protein PstS [Hyphomicrobiales bacterium]
MKLKTILAAGLVAAVSFTGALAKDVSGAGATFPAPVYLKWADAYKKATGAAVNYQGVGSGAGRKQIEARTVTFAGSDIPQKGDWLDQRGLVQWPMVMGGIVPIVNLEGIGSSDLVLDGQTLGDIYSGKIKRWNDAALTALNPKAKLPDLPIIVIRRSDGSGTTYNFTYYLSAVNEDFKKKVGTGEAVEWPVGIGGKGNDGVANNVMQTKGSIGYVELAFAIQNGLAYTDMINAAGKRVKPKFESFQAAAQNADWAKADHFNLVLANQPGASAWPMTVATFILMPTEPEDGEAAAAALKFFDWAYANGGGMAKELDYIPMPDSVVSKVKASVWSQIKK